MKKVNPEKRCFLQYDKLFIDGKVFMFSESTGKVEEQVKRQGDGTNGMNGSREESGSRSASDEEFVFLGMSGRRPGRCVDT